MIFRDVLLVLLAILTGLLLIAGSLEGSRKTRPASRRRKRRGVHRRGRVLVTRSSKGDPAERGNPPVLMPFARDASLLLKRISGWVHLRLKGWAPKRVSGSKAPSSHGRHKPKLGGRLSDRIFPTLGASAAGLALILGISVFGGGGAVSVQPRPQASAALSLSQQAEALLTAGDYRGAWRLYDQALHAAPEDVSLWYALGVTLSHLNRHKETEEAFRYVAEHGSPSSAEVKVARQWLISAGVLAPRVSFASAAGPFPVRAADAGVRGRVTWGKTDPNQSRLKVEIFLDGMDGPGEGQRFSTQAALGQDYRFERLPAGSYRLIGQVADRRVWDLALSVEDGRDITFDLSKNNSRDPSAEVH